MPLLRRSASILLVAFLVAVAADASIVWEKVAGAPEGNVVSLAASGPDLAVALQIWQPGKGNRPGLALRSRGSWEELPLPAAPDGRVNSAYTAVALTPGRLFVAESSVQGNGMANRLLAWDRAARSWAALSFVPMTNPYVKVIAMEALDDGLLLLTSSCQLTRWTGSSFVTPEGWPSAAFDRASCHAPFVRDAGRLFVVAGAVFEYRAGRIEYPPQPEGTERKGVAVLPDGLAFLQNGARGWADKLFVPGRHDPLGVPAFTTGPLFRFGGALYAGTYNGPARLGEGRWSYTRPAGPLGETTFGPKGPFLATEDGLYAGGGSALRVARESVRRLLPVVTRGSGKGGETYRTELLLSNFGALPVTARVELRAPDGLASGRWAADVPLPPGAGRRLEDVLAAFPPDAPSAGSLAIDFVGAARDEDVWAGADVVASRGGRTTRTHVPAPRWGSGPGYDGENAVGPLIRVDPAVRTNIGWADAGDAGPAGPLQSDFHLVAWGPSSEVPYSIYAEPGAWEQRSLADVQPAAVDGAPLGLRGPVYYGGPNCCEGNESIAERDLVAYAVEVDQESGDGTTTMFETRSLDVDHGSSLFFPAVVRCGGPGGVSWTSELRVGEGSGWSGGTTLGFRFAGEIAGERIETSWSRTFDAGPSLRLDAVAELFRGIGLPDRGQTVVGTLLVTRELGGSIDAELRVRGRRAGAPGAFGVVLGGLNPERLAVSRAVVPALANDARLRSNLAVANAGSAPLALRVDVHRASDGVLLDSFDATLGPGGRTQWNDVGAALPGGKGDLYAVIRKVSGEGRFAAYGVVHERESGDGAERPMTGVE